METEITYFFQKQVYLKKMFEQYTNDDTIVYTTCKQYIIFLKKLDDTITNESRKFVIDPLSALFRGNKFEVCLILHKQYNDPPETIDFIENNNITFMLNKNVCSIKFDENLDNIYGEGIYYYKDFETAYHCKKVNTGYHIQYYTSGIKCYEGFYLNNKKNGVHIMYRQNGNKFYKTTYNNGIREGRSISYGEDETVTYKGTYKNNKMNGFWTELPYNTLKTVCTAMNYGNYVNNKKNGRWIEYINGIKCIKFYNSNS